MGIKERIAELEAQKQIAEDAARQEEAVRVRAEQQAARKEQEREQQEFYFTNPTKFLQELPPVLAKQKELFDELRQIGVVGMIKEMAKTFGPKDIDFYEYEFKPREGDEFIPFPSRNDYLQDENDDNKDWIAIVDLIGGARTGTPDDPTLKINIRHKDNRPYDIIYYIDRTNRDLFVSYSPERVLTIQGKEITFNQQVDKETFDLDAAETALTQAFANPKETYRPVKHLGVGVRRSHPQPRLRSIA